MHPDGKIVATYGPPIGVVVMGVGIVTGISELILTGVGMAGAAVAVAFLFDLVRADDPELLS